MEVITFQKSKLFGPNFDKKLGRGGGSAGRAVASDSRGPRFESSHSQKIILNIYNQLYRKDENKEKEAGSAHFKKTLVKNFVEGKCE